MATKKLAEAKKEVKSEKIHEVDTAFLVNDFGFKVVHMQTAVLTDEQVATICEILESLEGSWDGASGIASGKT